jgi:hypothetical protein
MSNCRKFTSWKAKLLHSTSVASKTDSEVVLLGLDLSNKLRSKSREHDPETSTFSEMAILKGSPGPLKNGLFPEGILFPRFPVTLPFPFNLSVTSVYSQINCGTSQISTRNPWFLECACLNENGKVSFSFHGSPNSEGIGNRSRAVKFGDASGDLGVAGVNTAAISL